MGEANTNLKEDEIPVREGLFVFPDGEGGRPGLVASRCRKCGDVEFPKRHLCSCCDCEEATEEILIGRRGTLHTYTVVRLSYPNYDLPYTLGLVELPEGKNLRILAQLEGCREEEIKIGMPLELTIGKIKTDPATAKKVIGYKYRPARD